MLTQEIIARKRDGRKLDEADIAEFVAGITDGRVGDEQLGAFAMAVFLNGMAASERLALTKAMRDSGRVMDWSAAGLDGPVLDKHSTGGVGDTVSLILGPLVAACGGFVPMISGRGLGHTGGTLDKLASIPGYDPFPGPERLTGIVRNCGVAIIGQTDDLAPADRRFYAVRDVTATVASIPLICASILGKKLAEGLDALVVDVKTGSGSVMGDVERATELADVLCETATGLGTPTSAVVTDMNQVLARSAGNALEVREAIAILTGGIRGGRLLDLTNCLAVEMLYAGGVFADRETALRSVQSALDKGLAAERFASMVRALGGPSDLLERPDDHLEAAPVQVDVHTDRSGYVHGMDVHAIGMAVVELGGGRRKAADAIDPAVGLSRIAEIGDAVDAERPLARVHARTRDGADRAAARLRSAFVVNRQRAAQAPLTHASIEADTATVPGSEP
ncbi:MAG: thymidine phosphorylase [Candidatus Wenzhouxiangella sp. M2_3B_020]